MFLGSITEIQTQWAQNYLERTRSHISRVYFDFKKLSCLYCLSTVLSVLELFLLADQEPPATSFAGVGQGLRTQGPPGNNSRSSPPRVQFLAQFRFLLQHTSFQQLPSTSSPPVLLYPHRARSRPSVALPQSQRGRGAGREGNCPRRQELMRSLPRGRPTGVKRLGPIKTCSRATG